MDGFKIFHKDTKKEGQIDYKWSLIFLIMVVNLLLHISPD